MVELKDHVPYVADKRDVALEDQEAGRYFIEAEESIWAAEVAHCGTSDNAALSDMLLRATMFRCVKRVPLFAKHNEALCYLQTDYLSDRPRMKKDLKSASFYTHGQNIKFNCVFYNDRLVTTATNRRNNTIIHEYTYVDIINYLGKLYSLFGNEFFPLANNVQKLANNAEIDGFGKIIYNFHRNTFKAQGSSYLGVVIENLGILSWNNKTRGIMWKINYIPDAKTIESIINKKY